MADLKTIAGAEELFKAVNGLGIHNNYFIALKDTNREGMKAGLAGGMTATIGVGIIKHDAPNKVVLNCPYDAVLVNQSEKGFGLIPLSSRKIVLNTVKVDDLDPSLEDYVFLDNASIQEIIVKDFNIFNKNFQAVKFKADGKKTLHLLARKVDKTVPYQEENFGRFMRQYKKK